MSAEWKWKPGRGAGVLRFRLVDAKWKVVSAAEFDAGAPASMVTAIARHQAKAEKAKAPAKAPAKAKKAAKDSAKEATASRRSAERAEKAAKDDLEKAKDNTRKARKAESQAKWVSKMLVGW